MESKALFMSSVRTGYFAVEVLPHSFIKYLPIHLSSTPPFYHTAY